MDLGGIFWKFTLLIHNYAIHIWVPNSWSVSVLFWSLDQLLGTQMWMA